MTKSQDSPYWSDFVAWATDNLPSHGRDLSVENKEDWETYWACFLVGVKSSLASSNLDKLYREFRRGIDSSPGDPDGPEFIDWLSKKE